MPIDETEAVDERWVRIGRYRWSTGWAGLSAVTSVLIVTFPLQLGFRLGWEVGGILGSVLVVALLLGGTFALITAVLAKRNPQPYVDRARRLVRSGTRQLAFEEFDWAKLRVEQLSAQRRAVVLVIGAGTGTKLIFVLRDVRDREIARPTAELLAEVIRGSSIAMPTTPNDPSGRFARFNFPENISRDEALDLVENPPRADQKLPIGQ